MLEELGLDGLFTDIVDVHHMAYTPKPQPNAYAALLEQTGIDPRHSLFVEDMARNLAPAKALGMTTVWINNGSDQAGTGADNSFIDIEIANLAEWLKSPNLIERAA